ncbi:MAG: DUF3021 domain-containing protein [Antricoccus sp.]
MDNTPGRGAHDESISVATRSAKTSVVRSGLLRGSIPLVIMSGIALVMRLNEHPDAKSMFIGGVIATAIAGFSVIYDIESWSLIKQSAVHFGCMALIVFPSLIFSGWFTIDGPLDVLIILGYFLVGGAVLFSIGYLVFGKLLNGSTRRVARTLHDGGNGKPANHCLTRSDGGARPHRWQSSGIANTPHRLGVAKTS